MASDVTKRPPAFLNRMQDFKDEFEEIKVDLAMYHMCIIMIMVASSSTVV